MVRQQKRRQAKRRLTNVEFGNALLDREIDYRNARKRDQENTARALVVASGALMTVLLALSGDTGVLSADSSWWTRGFLLLTLGAAVCAAACGAWAQFPRKYTRLGGEAFNQFNNPAFLDSAEDQVLGRTLGARIGIAKKLDDRHEEKAGWLKASFVLFVVALVGLLGQGVTLAVDPPEDEPSAPARILTERQSADVTQAPTGSSGPTRWRPSGGTDVRHASAGAGERAETDGE